MKRIFITAGHDPALDPGAVYNGVREADLTLELRDLIVKEIFAAEPGTVVNTDPQKATLTQVWNWLFGKISNNDIAVDIHFNAAGFPAFGSEVFYRVPAKLEELNFCTELLNAITKPSGFRSRGIKPETQTQHKKLWIFNHAVTRPMAALLEICFISNTEDLEKYNEAKHKIAKAIAAVLVKWAKA